MAFDNIIGNQKVKDILISAIEKEKILHNYMFCGQSGVGKFLFAEEFAKIILNKNNTNLYVIEPEGNVIKIEQIRYMNSKIYEKPIGKSKKVYIIRDCEKMTKEAQNSLLKTLEEPPYYSVIILVCNQEDSILTTIKSRCTKLDFQKLTNEEIKRYFEVEEKDISDDVLNISDGSIEKALKRISKQEIYGKLKYLIENIENIDKQEILEQEFIYQEKDNIQEILEIMNTNIFQIAKEKNQYLNCISIVENTKRNLKLYGNFDMCIDNLLLTIWEEINEKDSRC